MVDPATGWFDIVKAIKKSATSIQYLFHNTWLHNTRYLNLLSLKMGVWASSNMSSNKCFCVTVMVLNPNQLQITTIHAHANAIIERVHKFFNDMIRSFDLENNHENLESKGDNPFDYFLQSTAWLQGY
jgi:hypothetical protein